MKHQNYEKAPRRQGRSRADDYRFKGGDGEIMKKITEKDYKLFQVYCKEWQKKLGLENWTLVFHFGFRLEDEKQFYNACVEANITHYQADIYLDKNYRWIDEKEFKESAKHEMLHILVARLSKLGTYRYSVTSMDMEAAEEELLHKLEHLII